MKKQIVILMLMLLLVLPLVESFGPRTHNRINSLIKLDENKGAILENCLDGGINEKAFRAGSVAPDLSVIYYYSQGGKAYKATHNMLFQQEVMNQAVTDDERCFGYGILTHLITDSISHTQVVPEKIKQTKVKNAFLHPLLEKKMDSVLANEFPEILGESEHMLDIMFTPPYGDRYIEMMEKALGENVDIDVRKEIENLGYALGSFYDDAFSPTIQDNSLFAFYPIIDSMTNFIHPIVGLWSVKNTNAIVNQNVELTLSVFENLGVRHSLSPHGFSELQQANEEATFIVPLILILLILVLTILPIFLIWWTKKFYWAFLFLLIFPILLLAITIIYAVI